MKTKFEYVRFTEYKSIETRKTTRWECRQTSSNMLLGEILYDNEWEEHYFKPVAEDRAQFPIRYKIIALANIVDFMKQLCD